MSHVVVFNASAKTVKVPTTPVKYLTDVRDEACQKFGVSKDQFTLKYNNKPISLSQQIRLANLPQGARLELVQASRSPTVISVALQLPASEKNIRLTQKFASNTSLWELLRQFESGQGANHNFTQRGVPEINGSGTSGAGRLNYEMPVVTVMPGHKEHSTFVDLQKTLSQLGFDSGSALLRLSFKNSGTPLEEAMGQISKYFKNADPTPSGAHTASSAQEGSIPDPDKAAPEATATVAGETIRPEEPDPEPMEVDEKPPTESAAEPTISSMDGAADLPENNPPSAAPSDPSPAPAPASPPERLNVPRNVQVFSAPTSSTPQAARQTWDATDYVPTIEHAKAHQAALNQQTKNSRLLSDKELEELENERLAKLAAVAEKGGSLRVRLPDGAIIQMDISKSDTAELLYSFVASFLDKPNEPFQLQYRGPNGRPVRIDKDKKRLLQELRFSPSELVTFSWDDAASNAARRSKNVLSREWADKAQTLKVEEPVVGAREKPAREQSKAEGKRKADMSAQEKESKLKNILKGGLFKSSKK